MCSACAVLATVCGPFYCCTRGENSSALQFIAFRFPLCHVLLFSFLQKGLEQVREFNEWCFRSYLLALTSEKHTGMGCLCDLLFLLFSSSAPLNSQQHISFPHNTLIRGKIQRNLFLLRAQNLVETSECVVGVHKAFIQIVFMSFTCRFET